MNFTFTFMPEAATVSDVISIERIHLIHILSMGFSFTIPVAVVVVVATALHDVNASTAKTS